MPCLQLVCKALLSRLRTERLTGSARTRWCCMAEDEKASPSAQYTSRGESRLLLLGNLHLEASLALDVHEEAVWGLQAKAQDKPSQARRPCGDCFAWLKHQAASVLTCTKRLSLHFCFSRSAGGFRRSISVWSTYKEPRTPQLV